MRSPLYPPIVLWLAAILVAQALQAQKPAPADACTVNYPQIRFILQAPSILPPLVKQGEWLQIQNFTENWKISEVPNEELIFSINMLSAIERNQFSMLQMPHDAFYFLDDYARDLKSITDRSPQFKYYLKISGRYWYDATPEAKRILLFTRSWARRLLATRQPDSTERFLLHVFAGDIPHPRSAFQAGRERYAELNTFQKNVDSYDDNQYRPAKNTRWFTTGVMAGSWFPNGNLQTLGIHPSVGFWMGERTKWNEFDVVFSYRFLHPTPRNYSFIRNDSMYTSNYYDGGYIGFDYTRYIFHRRRYELGLTTAVGYDGFDLASGSETNSAPDLNPTGIGSFDFSNGLRAKYFFRRAGFVGLAVKYHLIHYSNEGGTDLSGDAFSIDLLWGTH